MAVASPGDFAKIASTHVADAATACESGTGSSTSGEHPASAEYAFGTAVGYERTTAASGKESKNGEDIEIG
ncbi:hypothetical protein LTR10_002985 [Elasticomyces elasticus]|nr:hypothetical protein LTR10_002985 [Elasticomyces elasticus]KAK4967677.1 hypothetical protein LTR42_010002 [Elasticomyces elasticus]